MKVALIAGAFWIARLALGSDAEAVAKSFQGYKSAILEQKGEAAVALISKATVDEYQHFVDWALSADRKTLESLSFINRFQVLLMKHRIPSEALKKLDGRSAFVYAVDRDWIGKNEVIRTALGKVDIANNRATAEVLIGGQVIPPRPLPAPAASPWEFSTPQAKT